MRRFLNLVVVMNLGSGPLSKLITQRPGYGWNPQFEDRPPPRANPEPPLIRAAVNRKFRLCNNGSLEELRQPTSQIEETKSIEHEHERMMLGWELLSCKLAAVTNAMECSTAPMSASDQLGAGTDLTWWCTQMPMSLSRVISAGQITDFSFDELRKQGYLVGRRIC